MEKLLQSMNGIIVGQQLNVRLLVTALLAGGHVLLEGVPGLGKTKMVRTLARLLDGDYRRIQFTPDMMPSDITGNVVYHMKENDFYTIKGPVFTNLLLADEINRTPPKTQAALLEAMEEAQVTIQGTTYKLPEPFFVVATQNPVEYEGTYPLPEAQLDRFLFKLILDYPEADQEAEIYRAQAVQARGIAEQQLEPVLALGDLLEARSRLDSIVVEDSLIHYITAIIRRTRDSKKVLIGASPRGGLALLAASKAWALLEGRDFVTPDDIKLVARPVLRHRIAVSPQLALEGGTSDQFIQETLASVEVPR
ncbi:AAA family ATPase [Paenibacillus sp. y28]|uniref:AAA family ATPase n=1 Tax=Paenibacillus sp. y28 TaxID=3129110 RepID=UPI00301A7CED